MAVQSQPMCNALLEGRTHYGLRQLARHGETPELFFQLPKEILEKIAGFLASGSEIIQVAKNLCKFSRVSVLTYVIARSLPSFTHIMNIGELKCNREKQSKGQRQQMKHLNSGHT